ncbi:MAG: GNAT family N-acetyltransferase [Sphingomicrobium sp.]
MSLELLGPTELAAVVTYLEMRARPAEDIPPSALRLKPCFGMDLESYRALFRKVGAPWLWFSRLLLGDAELGVVLNDPAYQVLAVIDEANDEVGLLELDFRNDEECELTFVGLVPPLAGHGHGRWLLAEAVSRAWARPGVSRVHVHTCTLDHPAALAVYRRAGFIPYKRAVERFTDPRLTRVLPLDCAPQIAVLGTPAAPSARCA